MKTITTISDYARHINIPPPRHEIFDIRRFEDKVKTENATQKPFRHEFYAIGLRHSGKNRSVNGSPLDAHLFFNSPFQVVSWEVLPHWKGWYIMFGQEFLVLNPGWQSFLIDFPFFRLDTTVTMSLSAADLELASFVYQQIYTEYTSEHADKFGLIQAYTSILLHLTKRYFNQLGDRDRGAAASGMNDIVLLSRFQALIDTHFAKSIPDQQVRKSSFYARLLNVHPNYLNAAVKRVTGDTASSIIHRKIIAIARQMLKQSQYNVKQVSFHLRFKKSSYFSSFFKKETGMKPMQYKKKEI